MNNPEHDDSELPLSEILDSLSRIRDKLIEINEKKRQYRQLHCHAQRNSGDRVGRYTAKISSGY